MGVVSQATPRHSAVRAPAGPGGPAGCTASEGLDFTAGTGRALHPRPRPGPRPPRPAPTFPSEDNRGYDPARPRLAPPLCCVATRTSAYPGGAHTLSVLLNHRKSTRCPTGLGRFSGHLQGWARWWRCGPGLLSTREEARLAGHRRPPRYRVYTGKTSTLGGGTRGGDDLMCIVW